MLGLLAASSVSLAARADPDGAAVSISARASAGYARSQLPNGAYQPETFAFGRGGVWSGSASDPTIDRVDFLEIARTIAGPLAGQGYVSSRDPKATQLLIMVYWGTSHAPGRAANSIASQNLQLANQSALAANHVQMAHFNPNDSCAPPTVVSSGTSYSIQSPEQVDLDNAMTGAMAAVSAEDRAREQADARNAAMLGYDGEWDKAVAYKGTPLEFRRKELMNELEENRYFVVLMAYDFQLMWRQKKPRLVWEARYSIRDRGNDFGRQLAAMTQEASHYFGQSSGGLIRKALPAGRVDIGNQRVLEYGNPQ